MFERPTDYSLYSLDVSGYNSKMGMRPVTDIRDTNHEAQRQLPQASERRVAVLRRSTGRRCGATKAGFTIVEIVAVLLILGILAVVAVSRFSSTGFVGASETETLKSHLRYAQSRAMSDIYEWGIEIISPNQYRLVKMVNGSETTPVFLPGENSATRQMGGDISVSPSGITILFDFRGRPDSGRTLSISNGHTITVNAETGFIP